MSKIIHFNKLYCKSTFKNRDRLAFHFFFLGKFNIC